jgi:hypothetical protein
MGSNYFKSLGIEIEKPIGRAELQSLWQTYSENGKISPKNAYHFLADFSSVVGAKYDKEVTKKIIRDSDPKDPEWQWADEVLFKRLFCFCGKYCVEREGQV